MADAGAPMPLITIEKVSHAVEGRWILRDLDLRINQRRVGVIGPNGSGKSSFARLLNGLLEPSEGRVDIDGIKASSPSICRQVGFLFQNPDNQILFPTVIEDLRFGLENLKLPASESEERIEETARRFGLIELLPRPVTSLSGGEKQLLALAAVLVMRPRTLVFDEPATYLDHLHRKRLWQCLESLDHQIIMITHDLEDLLGFDRILVFNGGRLTFDGEPQPAIDFYLRFPGLSKPVLFRIHARIPISTGFRRCPEGGTDRVRHRHSCLCL